MQKGVAQKFKMSKWICRSPLAYFRSGPPFFLIFVPTRGQIYFKKIYNGTKIKKNDVLGSFGAACGRRDQVGC